MATIKEIKLDYEGMKNNHPEMFVEKYKEDTRAGVISFVEKAQRQIQRYGDELLRIEEMKIFERQYAKCSYICGIDEVGRGPLAGPVVAGAVILDPETDILYVNDSKKCPPKLREQLYDEIMEKALFVGIGLVSPGRIDEINILQATYEAMRSAIDNLGVMPDILLNDAVTIPEISPVIEQVAIVGGDGKSVSIAAASIIAKVTRDRIMEEFDKIYPAYGFAGHKGYGSEKHIEMLRKHGPCAIHRKQFIRNFI